ncbi:TetR/AcrR family transcriptional regulator [Streptomyces europaeiscabiei]|uniref:TetR/AcrR family transcriptional regulator n=1 Tax=Streptomyces TaxID=1883 RepID=UPI000A3B32B7|nr:MULTISPECIES: TetR/AcrR family transcriptional regulator [Streptomyces]MDX3584006.1 TetR/AcrR family transcriptional regulator [Streptomyces europaeiscabiei]MDX3618767.1 TetR/AcrR family transcriptional regulator [Streptomyces europaeiscabiei]MDX3629769.1 TetR/AcrR family transcriptional regulator [Streptomyces europaeiscabiei]MDX3648386.1 TetR/AcrR family transcriptional regulator [Streptomyces europaeiscabiei]WUD33068.1 TetR/AcrR family transcriptional regulator [Streptomyces europaeiscab
MPENPQTPADPTAAVIPSVWARPRRPGRERPALTRDLIVAEAVRLLDEEGADALSMRRLGARLNVGATSMYSHVASRDELIELLVDRIYGEMEVPGPEAAQDWRAAAARCAHGIRATILRHPWIAPMLGEVGVSLGPNSLRLTESMLAMLHTAGFTLDRADHAVRILFAYVLGMTTTEAAWLTMLARSGRSPEDWTRQVGPAIERATRDHPHLSRRYAEQAGAESADVVQDNFDHGLQWILDGLATRL